MGISNDGETLGSLRVGGGSGVLKERPTDPGANGRRTHPEGFEFSQPAVNADLIKSGDLLVTDRGVGGMRDVSLGTDRELVRPTLNPIFGVAPMPLGGKSNLRELRSLISEAAGSSRPIGARLLGAAREGCRLLFEQVANGLEDAGERRGLHKITVNLGAENSFDDFGVEQHAREQDHGFAGNGLL